MLEKIIIKNYALIDELEVTFSGDLNVITGETGAGKSIIVGALSLILGERADGSVLVNKAKKCVVEGVFDTRNKPAIKKFLEENDLETGEELIIRREIGNNGKSRAFVNDSPVTLAQLNMLSSMLVDLHQQFDTLQLGHADFQREVLDALAENTDILSEYQLAFESWQAVKKDWERLVIEKRQLEKEFDYNQFQFTELDDAGFRENELEELEIELKTLNNAEGIRLALSRLYEGLEETETPLVPQLKTLYNQLQTYASLHPNLPKLLERLLSAQIELQDIADETDHLAKRVSYDPAKIEEINERLSMGYKLLKKHGVKSTGELLAIRDRLEEKMNAVLDVDEELQQKEKETARWLASCTQLASRLSTRRSKQIAPLQQQVNMLLLQVGMPNAKLKVEIRSRNGDLNSFGDDVVEFLFDANKTGQFQPVRKVASGGELSRLMLCVKSLVARSIDLPTMIFDEIDTGISGEAARQVGLIMKQLAGARQVICITHQPQIASKADAHFFVYKELVDEAVQTRLRKLNKSERITAIAKMLGGESPTVAAMENAREMVMN